MNGDSQALSPDSRPIFPSNSLQTDDAFPNNNTKNQPPLFMGSDDAITTNYSHHDEYNIITTSSSSSCCNNNIISHNNNSAGLLRFRSAPSSLLENFSSEIEKSKRVCSVEGNSILHGVEISNNKSGVSRINVAMGSQLPPQYPRQIGTAQLGFSAMDSCGIMRQNSSPAGLFSHLTSQNGFVTTRGIGSYRMADGGADVDLSPSSSRLKNTMNFSSGISSSLGFLSRIAEVDEAKVGNNSGDNLFYGSGSPFGPWNESPNFAENFATGIKRELDNDMKLFAHPQNGEPENRPNILSHHLSLPKNSAEMASVEKLLHFQDSVPCKIRAKRGCATHPRSIAERVRRTRISERMRKLQDLVPNMDKQTNTSDMLDLAVDYIKNLQKEYKTLSENRANCTCLRSQKTGLNQPH